VPVVPAKYRKIQAEDPEQLSYSYHDRCALPRRGSAFPARSPPAVNSLERYRSGRAIGGGFPVRL